MRERNIAIGLHIIAWIIFLSLPLLLLPKAVNQIVRNQFQFIVTDALLIVFYYLNAYYLVPHYLLQKRIALYALTISLYLVVFLTLPYSSTSSYPTRSASAPLSNDTGGRAHAGPPPFNVNPEPVESEPNARMDAAEPDSITAGKYHKGANSGKRFYLRQLLNRMNAIILFLLVFALSTGAQLLSELFDTRRKKQKLEHERSKAELAFLRSQTNPHFFFNVLNSLYALSLTKSEKTPDAIMKLSSIMRYVITETDNDFVPLPNEIDYIEQYIDLQRLRLPEKTKVRFEVEGDPGNKIIAPLLLIVYIENAFKYGLSASTDASIHIHLRIDDSKMEFNISNQKFDYTDKEEKTNIGLENVKQRLDLLYPRKYQLEITDQEKVYQVKLILLLH